MRKQDIELGVLYAIWSGRGEQEPMPVAFLTTPADGQLYAQAGSGEGAALVKAAPGTKPGRGRRLGDGDTGYPVAELRWGWGCSRTVPDPETLLTVTLAGFDSPASVQAGQVRVGVLTHLGRVYGPWEQATAEYEALRDAGGRDRDWMRTSWR